MPIYEYACNNCEHTLDALQKMSDDPLRDCPECGKPGLKRLISAPRFRLKGAGWYETDFKKDGQRNLAKGDSDTAANSAKSETAESSGGAKSNGDKSASEKEPSKPAEKGSDKKVSQSKTSDSKSTASKSE